MDIKQVREAVLKRIKSAPKAAIYVFAAAVCAALIVFMRAPEKHDEPLPAPVEAKSETADYACMIEKQLEEIISEIQGVGTVNVMVTVEGTEELVYVQDTSDSDSKHDTETVVVGSKEALLKATNYPKIKGVLVVCAGGGKPLIKEKVVNAVATVLDIPTAKVYVTDAK